MAHSTPFDHHLWASQKMTLPQSSLLMVIHDNWMIWGYLHDLGNPNIYRWLFDIFLYFPIFSYIFIHFLLFIGFFKIFPLNTQELRACQSTGLSHQPPSVRTMAATTSTPAWLLDVARSLHGGEALRWHGGFHSHGGTPIAGWFTLW